MKRAIPLVLAVALLAGGAAAKPTRAGSSSAGPAPPFQHFRSRPDLKPPVIKIRTRANGTAPGYIFLAPKMVVRQAGPLILDYRGQVVWFDPLDTKGVADFKVQHYHGKPVLTWWRGRAPKGVGSGYYVIADNSYREIARVRAGYGFAGDIHEFLITRRNTALFTVYHQLHVDLSPVHGPKQGRIFDGIVQEVEIPSGRVLFEWHSYPQVRINESYDKPPPAAKGAKAAPYDYFHVNSIAEEPDGNLLVSARNTHAIYELNRRTGKISWRLCGKKSDFAMGPHTRFAWQHDARRQPDGTITLFDNGAAPPVEKFTRVLVLRIDKKSRKVTLVRSYVHPKRLLTPFEGNAQFLADGHVFVGWGANPYFSEFDRSGRVLLDAYFGHGGRPPKDADSYRVFRFPWAGRPTDRPALAVRTGRGGHVTVFASWNGATDIASWRVVAGADRAKIRTIATVPKTGFETSVSVQTTATYLGVRALSRRGKILGSSSVVKRKS